MECKMRTDVMSSRELTGRNGNSISQPFHFELRISNRDDTRLEMRRLVLSDAEVFYRHREHRCLCDDFLSCSLTLIARRVLQGAKTLKRLFVLCLRVD